MPLPPTVLIDTNILERYAYNFASPAITTFIAVAALRNLRLLLPDVIDRETRRHIRQKAAEAHAALKSLRKHSSFLGTCAWWPSPDKVKAAGDEIEAAKLAEWDQFKNSLHAVPIGYQSIDLNKVMDLHNAQAPPFGPGPKSREFADSFILQSALAYAKEQATTVAVVSADIRFTQFCTCQQEFRCFPDLPSLTEAYIGEMSDRLRTIKEVLPTHLGAIDTHVRESFPDLHFSHEDDADGGYVDDVEVETIDFTDLRVIEIGDEHCTVAFEADVGFSAYVKYDDPGTMVIDSSEDFRMALFTRAGTVRETAAISATIDLEFDAGWKSVVEARDLCMETKHIRISATAPIQRDDEEPPDDEEPVQTPPPG